MRSWELWQFGDFGQVLIVLRFSKIHQTLILTILKFRYKKLNRVNIIGILGEVHIKGVLGFWGDRKSVV